jgi:hypothetical protein
LENLSTLWEEIVVDFSDIEEPVEVVPHAKADLSLMLTGFATIWIELERPEASRYHLHYPSNNKSFPAIEYINNNWFYLDWNLRKYYTKLHSQIAMPINFGLNTWQDSSIDTSSTSEGSTISLTKSHSLKGKGNIYEYNRELTCILDHMAKFTNHFSREIAHVKQE